MPRPKGLEGSLGTFSHTVVLPGAQREITRESNKAAIVRSCVSTVEAIDEMARERRRTLYIGIPTSVKRKFCITCGSGLVYDGRPPQVWNSLTRCPTCIESQATVTQPTKFCRHCSEQFDFQSYLRNRSEKYKRDHHNAIGAWQRQVEESAEAYRSVYHLGRESTDLNQFAAAIIGGKLTRATGDFPFKTLSELYAAIQRGDVPAEKADSGPNPRKTTMEPTDETIKGWATESWGAVCLCEACRTKAQEKPVQKDNAFRQLCNNDSELRIIMAQLGDAKEALRLARKRK